MVFMTDRFRLLDHTADLAIEVQGFDRKELYENACMALTHVMVSRAASAGASSTKIVVSGQDPIDLLVRWLGEILYLFVGEARVVTSVAVRNITQERIEAAVETVPFDPRLHKIRTEVKGVTFHQAEVREKEGQWFAKVIIDV